MSLKESYPKEWKEIKNKEIPQKEIEEYLLKFVARLLREVKTGEREEDDIGDGWSMVINMDEEYYDLKPEVYSFLFRLGDYGLEDTLGYGTSEYGDMLYSIEDVEKELKRISKKLGIEIDL